HCSSNPARCHHEGALDVRQTLDPVEHPIYTRIDSSCACGIAVSLSKAPLSSLLGPALGQPGMGAARCLGGKGVATMSILGASAYIDVPEYLRAATNVETVSLLGLSTTVGGASSVAAGTVNLPVAASAGWVAGPLWLLDGPYSEMVQVTGSADGTHLSLAAPGTVFAHAPGVSASQAGSGGALAEALLRASAWIENYCRQGASAGDRSLFAMSRVERWGMPSSRAWLDRDDILCLRPGHFPVQSVASLSLESAPGQAL